ncbi:MAG: ImmA/IrrE family metallo-endopeptidase [Bacillota bacterium]
MKRISSQRRKELELIARDRASEVRRSWGLGIEPIADIFDLIERRTKNVIVLRFPSDSPKLSAFIAKANKDYLIYINSNTILGHQIFSAAHEMSHYLYDCNDLKLLVCNPGEETEDEVEVLANAFARYFLLPEEGVRHAFLSRFGVQRKVSYGHVMALQETFRVSYGAMLYALMKYGIINSRAYGNLKKLSLPENASLLQRYAKMFGVTDLENPTEGQIPKKLVLALTANYSEGRISYGKLKSILGLWGVKPEEMGFAHEDPL